MATLAELLELARRCHRAGDFQQAEQIYRQVLWLQPDSADMHFNLGLAYEGRTPQEWSDTIDRMVDRGVDASDAELSAVKAYLAKALPPGTQGPPKELRAPIG